MGNNCYLCPMKSMQSISETIRLQRENPDDAIYLLVQGAFYHAYNEGAEHLHAIMGYQIRARDYYKMLGFPINSLGCVMDRIHDFYDRKKVVKVQVTRYPHLIIKISDK